MNAACLLVAALVLSGCASALTQEGRCLANLTPDYLRIQEELASLESSWRGAVARRNAAFNDGSRTWPSETAFSTTLLEQDLRQPETYAAYQSLAEAKRRYQEQLRWYHKVYERVRTRRDEEAMLSDVRMVLLPGPGVIFYPLIRWNIHTVFWDGIDPDADSDPVTRYCADRLAPVVVASEGTPGHLD